MASNDPRRLPTARRKPSTHRFTTIAGIALPQLARLLANGSLDPGLNLPTPDLEVRALALQTDGKLVVSGDFSSINASARNFIARLSQPTAAVQSLSLNGSSVAWLRGGASPELGSALRLLGSTDATGFTDLGSMSRISGGWQRNDAMLLAAGGNYTLRAVGPVPSGQRGALGTSVAARLLHAPVGDSIHANGFEWRVRGSGRPAAVVTVAGVRGLVVPCRQPPEGRWQLRHRAARLPQYGAPGRCSPGASNECRPLAFGLSGERRTPGPSNYSNNPCLTA